MDSAKLLDYLTHSSASLDVQIQLIECTHKQTLVMLDRFCDLSIIQKGMYVHRVILYQLIQPGNVCSFT